MARFFCLAHLRDGILRLVRSIILAQFIPGNIVRSKEDMLNIFLVLLGITYIFISRSISPFASFVICVWVAFLFQQLYWRRQFYPPGPTPIPFIGNALQVDLANPARTFSAWKSEYGAVFTVWLPHPMVVIADHDLLKDSLIKQGSSFAGRPMGYIWSMFTKDPKNGDGIILCNGNRWQELRDFSHRTLRNFGLGGIRMEQRISNQVQLMMEHIEEELAQCEGKSVDIEEALSTCVANIIQDFVMGKTYKYGSEKFRQFKALIDAVLTDVASKSVQAVNAFPLLRFIPFPALFRYKKNGDLLTEFFKQEIEEHLQNLTDDGDPQDFMEAFLREMKFRNSPHLNMHSLSIAAGDLWTGGMETTVTSIRWALIYMIYHPNVQKRCREEIFKVFGTEQPSYARRKELPFVEATIAEVLRISNVLPWAIPHCTTGITKVGDFTLDEGTVILPQYGTVQFDETLFPNANSFLPERFIDESGTFSRSAELTPFGMGKRTCLGENLARYELFLIFTNLIQKYTISSDGDLPSLKRGEGMTNVPHKIHCAFHAN